MLIYQRVILAAECGLFPNDDSYIQVAGGSNQ
jgi:hypothetical protein